MRTKKLRKTNGVTKGVVVGMLCLSMLASTSITAFAATDNSTLMQSADGKFYSDYSSAAELQQAARDFNEQIGEEGMILLKNKDNTLPLKNARKVSVFGKSSVNVAYGGGGSGSSSTSNRVTLYDSLHNAGFATNPVLEEFYNNDEASGKPRQVVTWYDDTIPDLSHGTGTRMRQFFVNETPAAKYTKAITDSYEDYSDAALVVLSRDAWEGSDLSTNESKVPLEGYEDTDESNYLEFTNNERALIKHIKDSGKFKQIVVILNMSNAMEAKELANDDAIGGIVWIGHTGANAVNALGRILRGEVNPSGRTVDVWDAKHSYDPTWFNLRYNTQVDSSNSYYQANSTGGYDLINMAHFTEYEEGIYVGYRYYETAATVEGFDYSHGNAATPWDYDDAVTWTFGYGLSYTDFKWTLVSQPTSVTKDGTLTFKVKVENVGDVAGKDVVQLYYSAPYFDGGIEKSIVNLGDFTKTKLLQPGESQVVTLDIETRDMASFDYSDANGNGFRGYELEAGDYTVYLGKDAHCWADADTLKYEFTISEDAQDTNLSAAAAEGKGANGFAYADDSVTGNPIYTLFSNNDNFNSLPGITQSYSGYQGYSFSKMHIMSRADFTGTFPTAPEKSEYQLTAEQGAALKMRHIFVPADDEGTEQNPSFYAMADLATGGKTITDYNAPWYVASKADGWTQYDATRDGERKAATYTFKDMSGWSIDDERWETVLNELSWQEITALCSNGSFGNSAISYLGKPAIVDNDGPAMIKGGDNTFESCAWASECLIASTWSVEIAEKWGTMVGNEGLWRGTTGWYAPAMNTHRSPYGGRNFEYFSSDGVQGGLIGAAVVKGVQSKGIYAYIKHFALNDTDDERYSMSVSATEQAMREIYLKQFELAIKEGGANALMTGHNHIGNIPCHGNYALLTKLLRDEWGFSGVCVTDMGAGNRTDQKNNPNLRIRAGEDLPLGNGTNGVPQGTYHADTNTVSVPAQGGYDTDEKGTIMQNSNTTWAAVRRCAKDTLYATANSAAQFNGYDVTSYAGGALEAAIVGTEYTATAAYSGITNVTYKVTSGTLPIGLTINEKTGAISGTPVVAGDYTFSVTATSRNKGEQWIKTTAQFTVKVDATDNTETGLQFKVEDGVLKYTTDGETWLELTDNSLVTDAELKAQIDSLKDNLDSLKNEVENNSDSDSNGAFEIVAIIGLVLGLLALAMAVIAMLRHKNGKAE